MIRWSTQKEKERKWRKRSEKRPLVRVLLVNIIIERFCFFPYDHWILSIELHPGNLYDVKWKRIFLNSEINEKQKDQ